MLPLMIDVRLSLSSCSTFRAARIPIRTPAVAATDHGLLAPEPAAGIARVKSAKSIGVRAGDWPTLRHANAPLNAPDITTARGLRDRAIIAVLLGCALRRSEVAALTMGCSGGLTVEATVGARYANTTHLSHPHAGGRGEGQRDAAGAGTGRSGKTNAGPRRLNGALGRAPWQRVSRRATKSRHPISASLPNRIAPTSVSFLQACMTPAGSNW